MFAFYCQCCLDLINAGVTALMCRQLIDLSFCRALGKFRFTVGCAVRVLGLRKYHGMLSYLPLECDAVSNWVFMTASILSMYSFSYYHFHSAVVL